MFEARLTQGALLKRIIDSVKDLVDQANWVCSRFRSTEPPFFLFLPAKHPLLDADSPAWPSLLSVSLWRSGGISLQAMDSSHVSLVSLLLRAEGYDTFRCDRNINLGISMARFAACLRCGSLPCGPACVPTAPRGRTSAARGFLPLVHFGAKIWPESLWVPDALCVLWTTPCARPDAAPTHCQLANPFFLLFCPSPSSMTKILKCASNDDIITLKAEEDSDIVSFLFESPSE